LEAGGKTFLLGHGDGLGGAKWGYRLMLRIFHSRVCQVLFNQLHPWLAYRFGTDWSNSNRRKHGGYKFRGAEEPLYKFCLEQEKADYCVFGHFHDAVDMPLPNGSRLIVLKDWIAGGEHYACFDGETLEVR
jgi:UDP-2,3-diacylglucosamine hydrolase